MAPVHRLSAGSRKAVFWGSGYASSGPRQILFCWPYLFSRPGLIAPAFFSFFFCSPAGRNVRPRAGVFPLVNRWRTGPKVPRPSKTSQIQVFGCPEGVQAINPRRGEFLHLFGKRANQAAPLSFPRLAGEATHPIYLGFLSKFGGRGFQGFPLKVSDFFHFSLGRLKLEFPPKVHSSFHGQNFQGLWRMGPGLHDANLLDLRIGRENFPTTIVFSSA